MIKIIILLYNVYKTKYTSQLIIFNMFISPFFDYLLSYVLRLKNVI